MEASRRALDDGIELGFETDPGCEISATQLLVQQMIHNLVDNAIRHAGDGATAAFAVRRSVDKVLLRVEDDGRGIDLADRAALLERFHRGRNAAPGGSGLGLSIVAEIAAALGGSIDFPAPRRGRGFAIVVELPAVGPSIPVLRRRIRGGSLPEPPRRTAS